MKNKLLIGIATLLLFLPWTILPLRTLPWALASPAAEIMISCYAAFMIFGGIFTFFCYTRARIQNTWMKICLMINLLYAAGGIAAFGMMAASCLS